MPAPKPYHRLGSLVPNRFIPPKGQKKVYLPNFTLTLLRTPFAPPNYATFIVPLNTNKFDIKDYLYQLYGVEVISVRSYIKQAKVRQDKPSARLPKPNRWYRPSATKRMTIEMPASAPFVWPSPPEDFKPWDKDMHETAVKEREAERKAVGPDAKRNPKGDGKTLRQQAEELLSGKKAWRPGWVDWDVTGRVRGDVGAQVEI